MVRALVLEVPRDLVVGVCGAGGGRRRRAGAGRAACGLCGTDHEQYTGEFAGGFAFVPGHETVGAIEAIGQGRPSGGVWPPATG